MKDSSTGGEDRPGRPGGGRPGAGRPIEQLQEVEEKLATVFRASPASLAICTLTEGRYLEVNERCQELTGYPAEEMIGRTSLELGVWAAAADRRRMLDALAAQGRLRDWETEYRNRRGTSRVALLSVEPITIDGMASIIVAARDVTDRERLFDLSADLLLTGTVNGRVIRANAAWTRAMGYAPDELAGTGFADVVLPDDRERMAHALTRLSAGSPIRDLQVRVRTKAGAYRWISWNCDPPADGVLYGVGRDVTERIAAEKRQAELTTAIERAARQWTLTFDALDDPVVVLDHDGRVVRLNEAARSLAGRPHVELVGHRLDEQDGEGLWQRVAALAAEAATAGRSASTQVSQPGRSWDLKATPVTGLPFVSDAVIVIAHDMTSVVELQESVRRSETMAAMGALVAGVAHEVRNPLFAITATLDAFEARRASTGGEERDFRVVRRQLDRLTHMMGELLDYGRPPTLELTELSVREVVMQAVEATSAMAATHGIAVMVRIPRDLRPVCGDRMRLVQIFTNLITNALQHTPSDGRVQIEGRAVVHGGRSWIETVVSDSGSGFRVDDTALVFEPFFTRRRGGTGLGLSIVQKIVEQHEGTATASNRPEGGAAVTVRFPTT